MNKDLDERLVPNGQYRDAMNIQVSTSDSSDVGAIENVLGNKLLMAGDELGDSSYCVGTVADEKNDALYFFIAGPVYAALNDTISRDIIYEYKDNQVTPVVVDVYRIRTAYGSHDDTTNTILVPPIYDGLGGFTPYTEIQVGQHVQWDGHQRSFFGNNPIVAVSSPDVDGNITVTVANPFTTTSFTTQDSQMGSFIFTNPGNKRVLNFITHQLITGINILNDFIFWTDNNYEPKKISIPRCKAGTTSIDLHTKLVVPDRNITVANNILLEEKHVTLIRKAPSTPLLINPKFDLPITASATVDFAPNAQDELLGIGDVFASVFSNFQNGMSFEVGDEIRFLSGAGELPDDHEVRATVTENASGQPNYGGPPNPNNYFKFKIQSIAGNTSVTNTTYSVMQIPGEDSLFEKKFPRFSYRYKYQDGEYSTFAPFSDVIFSASSFDYDSKIAYNKGMQNYIESLELRNFKPHDLPEDVVQIDLLYKESNSPTIYIVDKIKATDTNGNVLINGIAGFSNWEANTFKVTSDLIYSVVPSNQLLRPYDNVPRVALAQEVTGNRVVFANYLQNYNLDVKPVLESEHVSRFDRSFDGGSLVQYELLFMGNNTDNVSFIKTNYDYSDYRGLPTLKTIRNYQVGVTYLDTYGRETPVFSNPESSFFIPKKQAAAKTQIKTRVSTTSPIWSKGFKFYVKETSSEYYNLAMDRVYRAEDGNVWLAFPSSERNKVDEETFLYLKKQVDSNSSVPEQAKYKIIAIENEAPEFIKTEIKLVGSSSSTETDTLLQTSAPVIGSDYFEVDEDTWVAGNNAKLIDVLEKLSLSFHKEGFFTKKYDVINLSYGNGGGVSGGGVYRLTLDRPLDTDDQWIYPNFPTVLANNIPDFGNNLSLKVYKHVVENKPEFAGKFFAKINGDSVTEDRLIGAVSSEIQYQVDARMNAYFLLDALNGGPFGGTNTTGVNKSDNVSKVGNNLDFNNPEDDIVDSEWFIDGVYYPMIHKETSGARGTGFHIMEHDHNNNPDGTQSGGYGRGIQQESTGQQRWYIELAHSQLKPDFSDQQPFIGSRVGNNADPGDINFADINENYIWEVGSSSNPDHVSESAIVNAMVVNNKFRFTGDTNPDSVNGTASQLYTITEVKKIRRYNHTRWGRRDQSLYGPNSEHKIWKNNNYYLNGDWDNGTYVEYKDEWEKFMRSDNRRIVYRIYIDKNPLTSSSFNPIGVVTGLSEGADNDTAIGIEFVSPRTFETAPLISDNPAVWETEPKENIDLNIFHEASQVYPINLDSTNNYLYVPKGSIVTLPGNSQALYKDYTNTDVDTTVLGWFDHDGNNPGDLIALDREIDTTVMAGNQVLKFTRHNNSYTTLTLADLTKVGVYPNSKYVYKVNTDVSQNEVGLSWYNAFSFSNGVESDRLRDDFNQVKLDKGPIVSTILDTVYEEERRSSGLIYSGIYNSNSGVNSLNQFIQAEKITKDLNPTYGSIQKLFSRNTDLIALCEDRVVRIQANKDAIFNADGNPQLIASNRVLGQTMPFSGDYGISKNPESFAVDNFRAYFTDKQRSAVLRLSKDGLTPISDYGMSDWFGDNLQNYPKLIGSFDSDKGDYNLTLREAHVIYNNEPKTLTYNENAKGWVSFKSFTPEQGISMGNSYYTFLGGYLYKHNDESVDRNTFYNNFTPSSVDVLLNTQPSSIKNYQTLNYEGTKSKVTTEFVPPSVFSNEFEGYDKLVSKEGWFVESIITNKQKGHVNEFIEKEGKWFNYIKGNTLTSSADIKTSEFSFQGIGRATTVPLPALGCTDSSALNYDPLANVDDGTCTYPIPGCMDDKAYNYDSSAQVDDGSCQFVISYNCDYISPQGGIIAIYDGTGTYLDPVVAVSNCPTCNGAPGCTDPLYVEYDPLAVCNDGSCLTLAVDGCTDSTIGAPFFPDVHGFCIDGAVPGSSGKCDPNNGYVVCNYDPAATTDDGSCTMPYSGCTDPLANNYDPCASFLQGCTYDVYGCTDPTQFNYDPNATIDDGSCTPIVLGCIDANAVNYDANANTDDGTCCFVGGCTNPTQSNYDPLACFDDGSCVPFTEDWAMIDPCVGCGNYGEAYLIANYPNVYRFLSEQGCAYAAYNNLFGTNIGPQNHHYYYYTVDPNTGANIYHFSCNQAEGDGCTNWILGCTDSSQQNYDPLANCPDNGTCIPVISGCTDPVATNYYPGASVEDGTCVYLGCDDPTQLGYGYILNYNHPSNGGGGSLGLGEYIDMQTYTHTFTNPTNVGTGINNGGPYYGQTFTYSYPSPPSPGRTFNPIQSGGNTACSFINGWVLTNIT